MYIPSRYTDVGLRILYLHLPVHIYLINIQLVDIFATIFLFKIGYSDIQ